jgi:hypothetical protein
MPTTITTDDELVVLLGTLGDTSDQIAAAFVAKGIKGETGSAYRCPVAKWLIAETGCREAEVDQADVCVRRDGGGSLWVTPPEPVADFIVRFDEGDYPDLIAEG